MDEISPNNTYIRFCKNLKENVNIFDWIDEAYGCVTPYGRNVEIAQLKIFLGRIVHDNKS